MPKSLPVCAVTGRIAGDGFACGDCDPCGATHLVPDVVKRLIAERDEWANKYEDAMETIFDLREQQARPNDDRTPARTTEVVA